MKAMGIVSITKDNFCLVEPLLREYKYNDFRKYRRVSKEKLYNYMKLVLLELIGLKENWTICLLEKGRSVGVASMVFLNWDSHHFRTRAAKIEYIISEGVYDRALLIKEKLLSELFKICKRIKVKHLNYRVDIEDISSAHALQKNGFQIMDVLVTKTYDKLKATLPKVRSIYKAGSARNKDIRELMEIARVSFKNDRFHIDPAFNNNKADQLYSQWILNSYKKRERIFVAIDRHDNPVGFLTYKLNINFKNATGLKVMGHGLMAVSPEAKGALISLMKATFNEVDRFYDYVEYDTRLNNYEVLKMCSYFNLEYVRAKYTFHKSLNL